MKWLVKVTMVIGNHGDLFSQAELDTMLIESAGNLIGPLITAAGSVITMAEINPFVKILLGKLVGTNKRYSQSVNALL